MGTEQKNKCYVSAQQMYSLPYIKARLIWNDIGQVVACSQILTNRF